MAAAYIAICIAVSLALLEEDGGESERLEIQALEDATVALKRIAKRTRDAENQDEDNTTNATKRSKKQYDYERAKLCLYQDYLGPDPFFGRQFERIFRITRPIFQRLWEIAANADPFFTHRPNPITMRGIYPEVKILMALKQLAFGVSPIAFCDYFQMGETAGRDCLKKLCHVIAHSDELRGKYLRTMSKSDAVKVSMMHQEEFGFPGNIGCLDCMHVYWRVCPMAWQGQFKNGKEDKSSLVLEAVADYNTWFWHSFFGSAGTNNDINIWDQSPLLKSMLDGTLEAIDFVFDIGGEAFNKLWIMVDGIYPELSRFVKTVSVPLNIPQNKYAKWQEGARKSVERAFGILQRKFQILCRPVELFYVEEIADIVDASLILHNMMVESRLERDESEREAIYDHVNLDENGDRQALVMRENTGIETSGASAAAPSASSSRSNGRLVEDLESVRNPGVERRWNSVLTEEEEVEVVAEWQRKFMEADRRWKDLYNGEEHHRLKYALVKSMQ